MSQMKFLIQNRLRSTSILLAFACAAPSTQGATRFTVSGKIQTLTRESKIAVFADKPFYGPPEPTAGYVLWNLNRNMLFVATVPIAIPLTLDGKKAGFRDLKSGQYVVVEYELVVDYDLIYCAATRIDAHNTVPNKRSEGQRGQKH